VNLRTFAFGRPRDQCAAKTKCLRDVGRARLLAAMTDDHRTGIGLAALSAVPAVGARWCRSTGRQAS